MIEEENVDTVVFCGLSETGYQHYMESQSIPMSETTYLDNYNVLQQVLSGYEVPSDLHESFLGNLTPDWGKSGVNTSFFYEDAEAYGKYVVEARLNGEEWQDYVVLPGGLVLVRDPSIMEVLEVYKDRVKGRIMSVLRENTQDARTFKRENHIAQPEIHDISLVDEILLENVREKVLATLTEEKLLREIDEDEMSHIQNVLDSMGERELAFNHLFGDDVRKVIDFETMDDESELYQLAEIFRERVSVNVDWKTGMVSASREITDFANQTEELVDMLMNRSQPKPKKVKKFQMKINKYFAKVEEIYRKYYAIRMKVVKRKHGDSELHSSPNIHLSVGDIIDNTTPEELANYYRILQSMELYTGTVSFSPYIYKSMNTKERTEEDPMTIFPRWSNWWRDNAGYIKNNYDELFGDKYAMIITRHPVDVLRMSDFRQIYSCHSPPSHPHHDKSFYKCAVAEAHGHGAIAYVVNRDELLQVTEASSLEEAERQIQDGEIFGDERRGSHVGIYHPTITLEPISRIRLRQVRYYGDSDAAFDGANADTESGEGTELAVPEIRVYGSKIPGIRDRLIRWVKEGQPISIDDLPKNADRGNAVDLDRFVKFGGSYEDNNIRAIIGSILPIDASISGQPMENTATQDKLPDSLGNPVAQLEAELWPIYDKWQSTYANIELEVEYEDDGADGAYAAVTATYTCQIPIDQVQSVPGYQHHEYIVDELNQFDLSGAMARQDKSRQRSYGYSRVEHVDTFNGRGRITTLGGASQGYLVIELGCNMEAFDDNGNGYFTNAEEFEDACVYLNEMDDKEETITSIIMTHLKREGFLPGSEYMQLAMDIENREIDSYEWDVETDGDYEESYESYAGYTHHYDYESGPFKSNPEVLEKLLNSREYRIMLRQYILATPKNRVGTEYNLTIDTAGTQVVANYVRHYIRFKITADDPSESIELFKELVTGEMDDEENLNVPHNKALANIMKQAQSGQYGDDVKEVKVRKGDYMSSWRNFIAN